MVGANRQTRNKQRPERRCKEVQRFHIGNSEKIRIFAGCFCIPALQEIKIRKFPLERRKEVLRMLSNNLLINHKPMNIEEIPLKIAKSQSVKSEKKEKRFRITSGKQAKEISAKSITVARAVARLYFKNFKIEEYERKN